MQVFIASDHAAYAEKEELIKKLSSSFSVTDLGPESADRCNYSDFAITMAKKIQNSNSDTVGILLCGSGIGMSMAANRFKGVRAALCYTPVEAQLSREHNDANVLCVGARTHSQEEIEEIAKTWLKTEFEGGRHSDRIKIFDNLGEHDA